MTTALRIAAVLALCAAALFFGIVRPATARLGNLADEYRRARDAYARERPRLERLERQARERERAATLLAHAGATEPSLSAVRRRLLAVTSTLPLADVRLDVHATRPPAFAELRVDASGRFLDLVALSTRIVRPGAGIALERVQLSAATLRNDPGATAQLSLEAAALGSPASVDQP